MKAAVLGIAAVLALAGPAVSKPDRPPRASAGPEAFVRWVYGHYTPHNSTFDSQAAYSPGLKALFVRNARLLAGPDGGVGENNDIDPVCQCQDWTTVRITDLKLGPVSAGQVPVGVTFEDGSERQKLGLLLVLTTAGWRIDDILIGARDWDLRARLIDENRRLVAAKTHR